MFIRYTNNRVGYGFFRGWQNCRVVWQHHLNSPPLNKRPHAFFLCSHALKKIYIFIYIYLLSIYIKVYIFILLFTLLFINVIICLGIDVNKDIYRSCGLKKKYKDTWNIFISQLRNMQHFSNTLILT